MESIFDFERCRRGESGVLIVGIDEAGRGPLAGPVVAAAAALKNQEFGVMNQEEEKDWGLVRDSKKLSEKQREKAFEFVSEHFNVGIGIVTAETIDRVNILQATFLAMKEAMTDLRKTLGATGDGMLLLVDGNQEIPNLSVAQETVIGGDARVRSIAAASIIAKVTRDRMMLEYDVSYPAYGFAKHKGYGTKEHMDALRRIGACPIHRMSFKPVFYSVPENVNRNLLNR
ncbi:MAG: ribonuclease HII [Candidatus Moranbacteria bacterium]|nr:ribonuclease HII [Candidatus Moranbacteria bacterium]NTW75984.1 ribonuclease HII [Candidatus Moranbacteria bacterium]